MGQDKSHTQSWDNAGSSAERQNRFSKGAALYRQAVVLAIAAAAFQACGNAPKAQAATNPTPEPAITWDFNGAKAYDLLKAQCAFGTRNPGSPGHAKCLDWLIEQSKKYSTAVSTQDFKHKWSTTGKEVAMTNVIAEFQYGYSKTVLLIAHWDTRPTADQEYLAADRKKPIPGANDGASGVAVLLELMRVLKDAKPNVNLIFLFVDGEDLGPGLDEMFLGAAHYAKTIKGAKPNYGILLDMIGDADLAIAKEPVSARYASDLQNRFYKNAESIGLSKAFPDHYQGEIWDDHIPLNEAGIPTMDLIDFEYPYWHTLADTPDKCSGESLGKVGLALESFLRKEAK